MLLTRVDSLFGVAGAADAVDLIDRVEAQGRRTQAGRVIAGVGMQRVVSLELLVVRVSGGRRSV